MTSEDRAAPRTEAGKRHAAAFTIALMARPDAGGLTWNEAEAEANAIVGAIEREATAAPDIDVERLRTALAGRVPPFVVDEAAAEYLRLSPPPVAAVAEGREAVRWHHSPDAPPEHFCEDCDALMRAAGDRDRDPADWTALANDIRRVDGNHDLGAGELAERLMARGWRNEAAARPPDVAAHRDKGIAFGLQEAADIAREMCSDEIAEALRAEGIRRYEALPSLQEVARLTPPGDRDRREAPGLRQQVERLRDKAVALEKTASRGAKLRHEGATQMAAAVLALLDEAPGLVGPVE